MSIAAFYRTYTPFMGQYSYRIQGRTETLYSSPIWLKSNIQPFRQGLQLDLEATGTIYTDWKTVYTRQSPVYEPPTPPAGAEDFKFVRHLIYIQGDWYAVTGSQDWRLSGRAPKHLKHLVVTESGSTIAGLPEPIPFATLVAQFESVVRELEQTVNIADELL